MPYKSVTISKLIITKIKKYLKYCFSCKMSFLKEWNFFGNFKLQLFYSEKTQNF